MPPSLSVLVSPASNYDYYKLPVHLTGPARRRTLTPCLHSPWVPTLPENSAPIRGRRLLPGKFFERLGRYFHDCNKRTAPSPMAPVVGPRASSEVRSSVETQPTAPRPRLLAPAPAKPETVARDSESAAWPLLPRRKLPPRRASRRTRIEKVEQACAQCRLVHGSSPRGNARSS